MLGLKKMEEAAMRSSQEEQGAARQKYSVSRGQWKAVGLYTLACFSVPVVIYSSNRVFRAFTNFHSRALNLKSKRPAGLFGWAFLMSVVYSSVAIPLYYKGALYILGLRQLSDLHGVMSDAIMSRFEPEKSTTSQTDLGAKVDDATSQDRPEVAE
jgi:ABC-type Fe3+ transport system permease subunit